MVDVENKIVYFGYGDVCVNAWIWVGTIVFTNIKPPCKCGESLRNKNVEYDSQSITINLYNLDLYDLFKTVSEDNKIVKYKGVTFDFTNYNQASVDVCVKSARNAVNTLALAC